MLMIPNTARLFLYPSPVNMRKSFEGLSFLIEEQFPGNLCSGHFFIFLNRRKTHIKILIWDGDGFIIWFKRLERGTFQWDWDKQITLNRKTFLMVLEGIIPKRIRQRFSLKK